jgi:hypothetical protein
MRRALTASALVLLSTISWMAVLVTAGGPFAPDAGAVLGADLVILGAVATTGMLLGASRWALRLGIGVGVVGLALAVALPAGPLWAAAVAASGLSTALLAADWTDAVVRGRPAASGPPRESVVLSLALVALPGVAAVLGRQGLEPVHWSVAGISALTAFVYARALPGALVAVRWLMPALLIGAAVAADGLERAAWVVLAAALAALGWRTGVRLAVRPLARQGTAVPIPPELAPTEILDAAGIDDRGRPRS